MAQPSRFLRLSDGQRARRILAGYGQYEHEQGATLRFVSAGDEALVILHHAIDGTQSQARAFADRLRGVERIEHSIRLFYAGAAVGELDHDFVFVMLSAYDKQASARFLESIQSILDDLNECLE